MPIMRLKFVLDIIPIIRIVTCSFADSGKGFPGIVYTACYMTTDITCGNIAQCAQVDNGKKRTAAFGYILVQ